MPLHKEDEERHLRDFQYLENTFQHNNEDGLLYEVSRLGASSSKAPKVDNNVENRANKKHHLEGDIKDVEPISSGDTKSNSGTPQTGDICKYLSRLCKPGQVHTVPLWLWTRSS